MKNHIFDDTIKRVVQNLKSWNYEPLNPGQEKKAIEIVFFLFYYARYIGNSSEEEYAYQFIEKVFSSPHLGQDIFYSTGLAGIGIHLDFLVKENFLTVDAEDIFDDVDDILANNIKRYSGFDYSFSTGLIGVGHYLLQRQKHSAVIYMMLEKLKKCFNPASREYLIDPLFLFPSEVLEDVKLFLLTLKKKGMFQDMIKVLQLDVENFENNKKILQSNCPDYSFIQKLRKAGIEDNSLDVITLLQSLSEDTSNEIWQGLSCMYLSDQTLPAWWKVL